MKGLYIFMAIYTNRQSLNEVYIGKEAVAPLFNQFVKVRNVVKGSPWNSKINTHKEILKFNRMAEEFFGFSIFSFTVVPNESMNACSLSFTSILTKDELKRITDSLRSCKSGFKFNPKKAKVDASIMCNMGLIGRDIFTDEEVFAIFLHEFGHCFFSAVEDKDSIYSINYYMGKACRSIGDIVKEIVTKKIPVTFDMIRKNIKSVLDLNPIKKVEKFFGINGIKYVADKAIKFFKEDHADNMTKNMFNYTNEKFADTFAAMYGYGPELHSALLKSTDDLFKFYPKNVYSKGNPIIDWLKLNQLLTNAYQAYIYNVADEHPNELLRVNISIQYIRKELSKENVDPKLKMQLVSQLNELQKLIDDYMNNSGNDEYMYIYKEYMKELNRQYGGDPRERYNADNDAIFDTMDKRYNEVLNK